MVDNKPRFDYCRLKGKIKEVSCTQNEFAKQLGIGRVSLSQRLNNKAEFSQFEINTSCEILGINKSNMVDYFFCEQGSETRTT